MSPRSQRLQEKRQSLLEKLLPRALLQVPGDVAPPLVKDKGKDRLNVYKPDSVTRQHENAVTERPMDSAGEDPRPVVSASSALSAPATGERLFVFQSPPESCDYGNAPKRKKKRNFLNLKKSSVAPTNLP